MNYDLGRPYMVPMDVAVRACAEAGYRYLDANLCGSSREGQPLAKDGWEKWCHEIRLLGDTLGIQFSQAHAYWTIGDPFLPDMTRADGEWGEELMRRSVIAAEILGVNWMVVHPYTVKQETWYNYSKSFTYNREYFKRWGEIFASHNVGMAIENMGKTSTKVSYCACGDEILEMIDAVDNPMVQICIDTGHAHLSGIEPAQLIRQAGKHLKATHIADNHQNKDEHFAPLNGSIDWPEVMRAIREIGYEESFSFEIHHLTSMYPAVLQRHLINFSYALGEYLMAL